MIVVNGKEIVLGHFPDGALLIKEKAEYARANVLWRFENNEELVALMFLVKHFRSRGVRTVCLTMPYVPNARQDRAKRAEDVFTLKYFAEAINSLHFDKVTVLDPHSSVTEALFDNLCVLSPKSAINRVYGIVQGPELNPEQDETVVFYPDEGAMKRYSEMLSVPYAFGVKEREWDTGNIKGLRVIEDEHPVQGRNVLIVDDICSRGGTFYHSAKKLKELGAKKVFLYVTHCENTIFDGEVLKCGLIDKVFTTPSLLTKTHERIEVVDYAD